MENWNGLAFCTCTLNINSPKTLNNPLVSCVLNNKHNQWMRHSDQLYALAKWAAFWLPPEIHVFRRHTVTEVKNSNQLLVICNFAPTSFEVETKNRQEWKTEWPIVGGMEVAPVWWNGHMFDKADVDFTKHKIASFIYSRKTFGKAKLG